MGENLEVSINNKSNWERIYDKLIQELRTNLVYVLVLVLAIALYRSQTYVNKLQRLDNDVLIKERDQWRDIANKAISRNFDYVDILIHQNEPQNSNSSTDSTGNAHGK